MRQLSLELAERDRVLDRFEATRADLIEAARGAARVIVAARGEVTAPDVLDWMRARGWAAVMAEHDSRWAGALFRKGWRKVGYRQQGSHGRPVAVWRLA